MLATRMRYGGTPTLAAASITNTANQNTLSSATFTSASIGAANPARRIVLMLGVSKISVDVGITSVTCAGVAMTAVPNTARDAGNCASQIFELPQSALGTPTATTATFVATVTGTPNRVIFSVCRVLSYDTAVGGGATRTTAGSPAVTLTSSAFALPANGCAAGLFMSSANSGDAVSDAEHTWNDHLVEGDQLFYAGTGGGENAAAAIADFTGAVGTFDQRNTYQSTGTPNHQSLSVAGWGPNA